MSYHPQYPYQPDNGHGSPPQGPNDDERRTSPHSRSPPSVQVGSVSRTSRSVSSTRITAPSQARPIDPYVVGQNWESDPRHVLSTPASAQPYVGSYGQYGGSSIQDRSYVQSVEQQFQQPDHPPPHASRHHRTSYSMPQQHSVPYNEPYPVHSQNAQSPQSSYESGEQSWGMQQPSSQYPQQQTWGLTAAYSQQQQPSPPQYSHQQQPYSQYPRQPQPPSRYPGSGTWSNIAGESLSINDPGLDYQADSPPSAPVGGSVRCPRCGTTYPARGRSGSRYGVEQYDTEPGNLVGYAPLPPCPTCGHHPVR